MNYLVRDADTGRVLAGLFEALETVEEARGAQSPTSSRKVSQRMLVLKRLQMMNNLGKFWVKVDTSVTGEQITGYYFPYKSDRDARVEALVEEFGVEVINEIGDKQ